MRGLTDLEREYLTEHVGVPFTDEPFPPHLNEVGYIIQRRGLVDAVFDPTDGGWWPVMTALGRTALMADAAARGMVAV